MGATNSHTTVYLRIYNGTQEIDLTGQVSKFSTHLSNVEDSNTSFTINSRYMTEELDELAFLKRGQIVYYQFGYINNSFNQDTQLYSGEENLSDTFKAVVADVNYTIGSAGCYYVLKCTSVGYFLRKTFFDKVWTNMTASDIVREIARQMNMVAYVDNTSFQYSSMPQGTLSNMQLIKKLARLEAGFITYVVSDELHFIKRGTDKKPQYRLDIRNGGNVIDASFTWNEIQDEAGVGSLFKDSAGNFSTAKTIESTEKVGEAVLGTLQSLMVVNPDNSLNTPILKDATKAGENNPYAAIDNTVNTVLKTGDKFMTQVEDAWQQNSGAIQKQLTTTRHELTADITVNGVPFLRNDKTIYITGVPKHYEGKWYIEEVSHNIEETFTTSLRLNKNGIRRTDDIPSAALMGGGSTGGSSTTKEDTESTDTPASEVKSVIVVNPDNSFNTPILKDQTPLYRERPNGWGGFTGQPKLPFKNY